MATADRECVLKKNGVAQISARLNNASAVVVKSRLGNA